MSTILITGASGNLGKAVVSRLSREAHKIITLDRSLPEDLDHGNKLIENVQVNLVDAKVTEANVKQLIEDNPELDAAILLVGGFAMGGIDETSMSDIDNMISLNFKTAYNMVHPLLPYFLSRAGGGHFILVGARPVLHPDQGRSMIAYTLSKTLVFKLAEFINAEGKDKNVGATVVVPSIIDTEINREAMPDADFSTWVPPERIADAIACTLSASGRMTRDTVIKIYNNS
jgi:NAD(P)-dependent dehydrogenase (short-subunit alcohol dehydrogenase family)